MNAKDLLNLSRDSDEGTTCATKKLYGKHRGLVVNNVDLMGKGRIQAIVPDVSNILPSNWANPALPFAGIQSGMVAMPPMGSWVWMEYENGDHNKPIWTGCFWGSPVEVPLMSRIVPPAIPGITLQTPLQNGITISDTPGPTGGIVLQHIPLVSFISVNDAGITINNGLGAIITMLGPTIALNATNIMINGAVTVNGGGASFV